MPLPGHQVERILTLSIARLRVADPAHLPPSMNTPEMVTPLLIISHAATGESMPEERRAAARPAVPSGRPPCPGIRSS